MDFTQLSTLVAACIASAGGISVIILAVIRLSSSIITERLSAKFENKLEKALQTHKTELNRKEYVSKTRFDAEFKMYQELSEKNISMVYCAGETVTVVNGAPYSSDELDRFIDKYCNCINNAEIANKRYAPFIAKEIFDRYLTLEKQCSEVFILLKAWKQFQSSDCFSITVSNHDYHNQKEIKNAIIEKQRIISNNSDAIINDLRNYLSKLDVL